MNRIKYIAFGVLLFSWCCVCINAQDIHQDPKLIKGKLQNGLTYYIYPNDYPKGQAIYRLFIRSGSLYEENTQKGLAHFLEHMAFNGTTHFPGNSLVDYLQDKGGKFGKDLNAHTSYNETVYKLQMPTHSQGIIDTTLMILSDWANGIVLGSEQIDKERGVIMSEWLSKKNPESEVSDILLMDLFNNSRFSERKVIGDTAVILNFKHDQLRDYYKKWYQPNLMAVAVIGDIDTLLVKKLIIDKFGSIRVKSPTVPPSFDIPDYTGNDFKVVINKSLKEPELNVFQLIPLSRPIQEESDYLESLQTEMINRLIRNRLNDVSFSNNAYSKSSAGITELLNTKGLFFASVSLFPDKIDDGITAFVAHLEQIYQQGFLPVEINKVKKAYLSQLQKKNSAQAPISSFSMIDKIYSDFYRNNKVINTQEEYRLANNLIDRIDSASIANTMQQRIRKEQLHFLYSSFDSTQVSTPKQLSDMLIAAHKRVVNPYELHVDTSSVALLQEKPHQGKIVSTKTIPEIKGTELLLSNGVKIIYKPSVSDKDRVNISAFKMGGLYALDSVDYYNGLFGSGVISLSGAGDFSRQELSYFLTGNSASVNLLIDKTRSGLVASSSVEDIETLFQLLYLKWTFPKIDKSVFELTKDMFIKNYRNKNITGENLFYQDLNYLMRGKDYVSEELTDSILLTHVDINRIIPVFKKSFGNASGFTFVIVSSASLETLIPYIEIYLGGLNSQKDADVHFNYAGGQIRTENEKFIRKAGNSPKATVSLIFQQVDFPNEIDIFKLQSNIADDILRMKFLQQLREEKEMIYSISVSTGATFYPAKLVRSNIIFTCQPENADILITDIREIIDEFANDPQKIAPYLKDVKTNLLKEMELNKQKDSFWSTFLRNTSFNKQYNWSYVKDFETIVHSITKKEIADIISTNFDSDKMIEAVLLPK